MGKRSSNYDEIQLIKNEWLDIALDSILRNSKIDNDNNLLLNKTAIKLCKQLQLNFEIADIEQLKTDVASKILKMHRIFRVAEIRLNSKSCKKFRNLEKMANNTIYPSIFVQILTFMACLWANVCKMHYKNLERFNCMKNSKIQVFNSCDLL